MKKTVRFASGMLFLLASGCSGQKAIPFPKPDAGIIAQHLEAQTAIVPRYSGSDGAKRTAELIKESSKKAGAVSVQIDEFPQNTVSGTMLFRNVIAEIPGKSRSFILIAAHYDTKFFDQGIVFQGANDGASGVAALLEMIRCAAAAGTPSLTLKFVFFDGEECRYSYSANDGLHGSRHLAEKWKKDGTLKRCRAMILLDMIGDRDLQISIADNTHPVLKKLLKEECAGGIPVSDFGGDILDDHVPFQKEGIPAVDLIDFEYGPGNMYWHTSEDNMNHVSAASVAAAADLALRLIRRIEQQGYLK